MIFLILNSRYSACYLSLSTEQFKSMLVSSKVSIKQQYTMITRWTEIAGDTLEPKLKDSTPSVPVPYEKDTMIESDSKQNTMQGFSFSICIPCTRFCPVPSWHHLLFGMRLYGCALCIRYWFLERRYPSVLVPTYHLLFPFIQYSWYIVVFIDNYELVRYVSQQRRLTRFPHWRFPYQ